MKTKIRIRVEGYVYLDVPEELLDKDWIEMEEELQKDLDKINFGELESIETEFEELV